MTSSPPLVLCASVSQNVICGPPRVCENISQSVSQIPFTFITNSENYTLLINLKMFPWREYHTLILPSNRTCCQGVHKLRIRKGAVLKIRKLRNCHTHEKENYENLKIYTTNKTKIKLIIE